MRTKMAFTIVEVLVASAIMVLLVSAGFYMLHSGSKSAGKGGSSLASALAAGNLARRLELDIECAQKIEIADQGAQGSIRMWADIPGQNGELQSMIIIYSWPASNGKGLVRKIDGSGSALFCGDRFVHSLELIRHDFDPQSVRHGYQINLLVSGDPPNQDMRSEKGSVVDIRRFASSNNANSSCLPPAFNFWQEAAPLAQGNPD